MPSQKSVVTHVTMMLCLVMAIVTMSHVEASGTWSPTGSMSTARARPHRHVAARWPSAGHRGFRRHRCVSSAELYDPALGTWSPTAAMSTARYGHTATLLTDGRVLVSGGSTTAPARWRSAEIYDPALGTWSPTGSMSASRYYHTATLLPDGRVLVSGGVTARRAARKSTIRRWAPGRRPLR